MSVNRALNWVIVALVPCILMAIFNTGYQANLNMAQLGIASVPGWRGFFLEGLAIGYDPSNLWANFNSSALGSRRYRSRSGFVNRGAPPLPSMVNRW